MLGLFICQQKKMNKKIVCRKKNSSVYQVTDIPITEIIKYEWDKLVNCTDLFLWFHKKVSFSFYFVSVLTKMVNLINQGHTFAFEDYMDSYVTKKVADYILYSEDGYQFKIHKEIFSPRLDEFFPAVSFDTSDKSELTKEVMESKCQRPAIFIR